MVLLLEIRREADAQKRGKRVICATLAR